jgi:predicted phosphodiesterase
MNSSTEDAVGIVAESFNSGNHVWVLSDIHGNRDALDAALALTDPDDPCVFLGDLLTYGCQADGVIDRIAAELDRRPCLFIWGNHDQMYRELARGVTDYYYSIPSWIRESVDWTRKHTGTDWLEWPWLESATFDGILFDHANPYPYGDWTYLNSYQDHVDAMQTLLENGHRLLLVGHTHRAKALLVQRNGAERWVEGPMDQDLIVGAEDAALVNTGSVGQPRNRKRTSTLASLRQSTSGVVVKHHQISYDSTRYLAAISRSGLSEATQARLSSFFVD